MFTISQGYLIPAEGNKVRAGVLGELLLKQKQRKKAVRTLGMTIVGTLLAVDRDPIPLAYTHMISVDLMKKVAGDRRILMSKKELLEKTRRVVEDMNTGKKPVKISMNSVELALHLLRGMGFVEFFPRGPVAYIALTQLGSAVRNHLSGRPSLGELPAVVFASLAFSTKARITFSLFATLGEDLRRHYSVIRAFLFSPDTRRGYAGMERAALEVLNEIVMTKSGTSAEWLSETSLLISMFKGLRAAFGDGLVDIFRTVNRVLRFPLSGKLVYEAGAWDLLQPGQYLEIDEVEEKYRLSLGPLLTALSQRSEQIEYQLQALNSYPARY